MLAILGNSGERPSSPTAGTSRPNSAQLEGTSPERFGAAPLFGGVILMISNLLRPNRPNRQRRSAMPLRIQIDHG
jgi:hypothetical protein